MATLRNEIPNAPVAAVARGSRPDRPHFSFPFERAGNGSVKVLEQDTVEHIMSCENVIVRCPLGFRVDRPEFGWQFPLFRNAPLNLDSLRAALQRWEPRGRANVHEYAEVADAATRRVIVDVEITQ